MLFEEFLKFNPNKTHHAVLLISTQFNQHDFPQQNFAQLAKVFCQIQVPSEAAAHPDILIVDRERSILRIEDVKKIKDFCLFPPQLGKKRLIFIERCERLNPSSANSLLKSLEEPSANVLFILTTAKKHLVLPTILSRLQKINLFFSSLPVSNFLQEFDQEDIEFIKKIILSFSGQSFFLGKSLSDKKNFSISPVTLAKYIEHSDSIAKKYTPHQLQAMILYWVSERLKKEKTFVIIARFIVAHIRSWKQAEPLNPSSQFWLLRIFLGQHTYENS